MKINAAARLKAYTLELLETPEETLQSFFTHLGIHANLATFRVLNMVLPGAKIPLETQELKGKLMKFLTSPIDDSTATTTVVSGKGVQEMPGANGRITDYLTFMLAPHGSGTVLTMIPRHLFLKFRAKL